jgi:REP element-mobilizing transposase RayT
MLRHDVLFFLINTSWGCIRPRRADASTLAFDRGVALDRCWLLTNTCYVSWLPGDPRGFVGHVLEHRDAESPEQRRVIHDIPGTPCDEDMPGLQLTSLKLMRGPPINLNLPQAEATVAQFLETATFRGWRIDAIAVMFNHFHIVVGVPGDPPPSKILGDFKSYATRSLSKIFGAPASKTWWTQGGSKRKLKDESARYESIDYVLHRQYRPLVLWPKKKNASVEV